MSERDLKRELKKAEKVPGLKEHLDNAIQYRPYASSNGSKCLKDLTVNTRGQMAAYIIEEHEWNRSGHSGIEMAARVSIFKKGKSDSRRFVYRDKYDPDKDDWSLAFDTIHSIVFDDNTFRIWVQSANSRYMDIWFNL